VLHCAHCGANISPAEYAKESPLPSDELCADCEYQSLAVCAACRIEWAKVSHSSPYICPACRANPVLR
jgi:hypothetical protein